MRNGLTVDDAGCLAVEGHEVLLATDGRAAIEGLAEGIDDTAKHFLAHLNGGHAARTLHHLSFLNTFGSTHEHHADIVFLKVHCHAHDAVLEFYEFVLGDVGEAMDASHAIANAEDDAYFFKLDMGVDIVKLAQQYVADFTGFDFC